MQQNNCFFTRCTNCKLENKIYHSFGGNDGTPMISFCIRRFNLTHQMGCSSAESNNYGVPLYVQNTLQLDELNQTSSYRYILLINIYDFSTISQLR